MQLSWGEGRRVSCPLVAFCAFGSCWRSMSQHEGPTPEQRTLVGDTILASVVSCQWCFGFSGLLGISQQCPWRYLLPYSTVAPVVGHHMHSWIIIVFVVSRSTCCSNTQGCRPCSALRFPVQSAQLHDLSVVRHRGCRYAVKPSEPVNPVNQCPQFG